MSPEWVLRTAADPKAGKDKHPDPELEFIQPDSAGLSADSAQPRGPPESGSRWRMLEVDATATRKAVIEPPPDDED